MLTKKEFVETYEIYSKWMSTLDKLAEIGINLDIDELESLESNYVKLVSNAMDVPIDPKYDNIVEDLFFNILKGDPEEVYNNIIKKKFYSVEEDEEEEPDDEDIHEFEAIFGFNLDDLDKILKVR